MASHLELNCTLFIEQLLLHVNSTPKSQSIVLTPGTGVQLKPHPLTFWMKNGLEKRIPVAYEWAPSMLVRSMGMVVGWASSEVFRAPSVQGGKQYAVPIDTHLQCLFALNTQ